MEPTYVFELGVAHRLHPELAERSAHINVVHAAVRVGHGRTSWRGGGGRYELVGRREVRSGRGGVAKAQLATTPPHGRCGCNGTWRWRVQWRESGWRDAYRCNRYVLQTPLGLGGLNVGRLLLFARGLGNEAAGGVAALERRRPSLILN